MTGFEPRGVSGTVKVLVACAVVALAALALTVAPARACSCIPPDPWELLKQADGAFAGRLVSRREDDQGRVVLVFRVDRVVKGKIGDSVEVRTASNGAACGIETPVGQRIGLFLDRLDGAWVGTLCGQVSPEDLIAAAVLPAPNGRGPAALLVGGRFGPARTLALDANGRTLGYGMGAGSTTLLSMCPGRQAFAEVAPVQSDRRQHTTYEIAIREATSLRVLRQQRLRLPGWRFATGLLCEERTGSSVVVFANWAGDAPNRAALYRLTPGRLSTIWHGTAFLSSFGRGVAFLNEGFGADRLVSVDLRTGRVAGIAWLPRGPRLISNAAGTKLAGVAYSLGSGRSRVFLVDLETRPASVRSAPLAAAEVFGDVLWISENRLLFLPSRRRDRARVLDLQLRTLSRFEWTATRGARVGRTAFGISGRSLVAAGLPSGPQRNVRILPGQADVIVTATR